MTLVTRSTLVRLLSIALILTSVPALAAGRRRASEPPSRVLVTVTGTVTDSVTGAPVAQAVVTDGRHSVTATDQGTYSISVYAGGQVNLTAQRFGYSSSMQSVKIFGAQTVNFTLAPEPPIIVKLTSGEVHKLDFDSSQFAYLIVFSGYAGFNYANFCKLDGTGWQPQKSEFSRIVGPATPVTVSACCTLGPTLQINVEMKNGDKLPVTFVDACFGSEVDFIGRDLTSLKFAYFRFTDIAEIDFP